ncbi:MFS transporter [Opitutaceae bacterium EW11]|nr:MFS transporter [Opitutaceae bacterium EW11]
MDPTPLPVREKIGYGLGDAASHIVFDNVMFYMMFFYTDVFGLPAAFVGGMFLLARALDAVSDPIMGWLADRTHSRWGKFRPYLLWGSLPFGISCVLAYSTPDLSSTGKHLFAAATYTLLTLMYTVVNIPYCALGGVVTGDDRQRISLQSYRFVLATAGGMLSTVLMVPLATAIGGANKAVGYRGAIALLAAAAVAMLLLCFATTRERLAPKQETAGSFWADLRAIAGNDQWRIVGVLTVLNILAVATRGGAMMYYVTYLLGDAGLFTAFLATYSVGNILGCLLTKPLTDRYCKVSVFAWINLALAALSALMMLVPAGQAAWMFSLVFAIGVLHQLITPIQWVMMSDTVDYGEWKSGKRLTGVSFAGTLFVLKLGLALSGALIGWTLSGVGYASGAARQSPLALKGIVALFTLVPSACYLASVLVSRAYRLRRDRMQVIAAALAAPSPK